MSKTTTPAPATVLPLAAVRIRWGAGTTAPKDREISGADLARVLAVLDRLYFPERAPGDGLYLLADVVQALAAAADGPAFCQRAEVVLGAGASCMSEWREQEGP